MSPSPIRIKKISLYSSRIRLKEPFIISLGRLDHAEHVIVVIRTDAGITGFGECSPFRTIHGESVETGMAAGRDLARVLIGQDALQIAHCISRMDACFFGNSSIKSAFDIALHDIAAKHAAVPLYRFLGGSNRKIMHTDYTVSIDAPEKMVADAMKIKAEGFQTIKIKLGESPERDVMRMRMIREAVGPAITLRIDANQGWNAEVAGPLLNVLSVYNIQHCEEPIPRWSYTDLPGIREKSPIPIMADESCFDEHDAERLIRMKACDSINIKLGKSSGIHKAMKIVRLAEAHGMNIQAGGFLESRLGFTATAHFALSSDRIIYFDFDTPLMFSEDPVKGGIRYGKNGLVEIPDAPGLGAWYDEDYLAGCPSVNIGPATDAA